MTIPLLISDQWRKLNAQLHEQRPDFGSKHIPKRIATLGKLARDTKSTDILDYGCGKGALLKESGFRFAIRGYDPAVPEFSAMPAPAHLVACWDVLEHVEPEYLDNVLDDIERLATKAVHLIIATRPDSTKLMPDGRNPHLIIKPAEWWLPRIRQRWPDAKGRFSKGELEIMA